ncbi:ABC transporter ATP-binding protein [Roseateles saccharophilus]|uniref:Putative ABC transport system ATP-binding protein n=1 Tax=Roseateles saccharophilus TaxID=304 RepID=A0A4R3UT94_ROSSA|nr:ATP-binding cassette domain-containing protein [Roseateles saccharophilus]MDG0833667.1 ATP-binding cassette domain-containing protein [Roseateles saccharophilus]TCU93254.1 putative ABC transport system ATP-binding protein [Roseateles saccharophilus]
MLAWQGLAHHYAGAEHAIRYADFALGHGRHLLLRGASGSGKSTLLALLSGLLRVQQGWLEVAGTELAALSPRELDAWRGATLGVVPQRLHLSEALTVAENLALPALAAGQGADPARAAELLDALDIAGLAGRRPHQLSVGQAQRVALARALMRRPRLLLADEPSANLDDEHTVNMLALLLDAAEREGCTLVIASHDARVVEALGGRDDVSELSL